MRDVILIAAVGYALICFAEHLGGSEPAEPQLEFRVNVWPLLSSSESLYHLRPASSAREQPGPRLPLLY